MSFKAWVNRWVAGGMRDDFNPLAEADDPSTVDKPSPPPTAPSPKVEQEASVITGPQPSQPDAEMKALREENERLKAHRSASIDAEATAFAEGLHRDQKILPHQLAAVAFLYGHMARMDVESPPPAAGFAIAKADGTPGTVPSRVAGLRAIYAEAPVISGRTERTLAEGKADGLKLVSNGSDGGPSEEKAAYDQAVEYSKQANTRRA